ncbi:MAG: restriction endonuclease subunit S [Caldisericia bacterium]|nr:restriction endonuclease subunit S [Caldisericia bacterium]
MEYVQIPNIITYKDLEEKHSLSPSSYKILAFKNKNVKKLRDLLLEKPTKGEEVGSFAYINKSNFYFIRTKALQSSYFLPVLNNVECAVPILPTAFKNFNLQKGDILLAKDANIGDVAYLDKDVPKFMISGGIVRLRFLEDVRYYVLGFMKHKFFKAQIDLLTARGATIRHAKTLWLDTLIPFPNQQNADEVIKFVSLLTRSIIRKEAEIKKKYYKIMDLIDREIKENQKPNKFYYTPPTLKDLEETGRLDAGVFCENYKKKQFIIENYTHGAKNIFELGFDFKRGQNLQVSQIGRSIYTEEYKPNFYKLIRPLNLSDYGTVTKYEYLGNPRKLQVLNKGEILFSAEGTIGRFCVFIDIDNKAITNIHGITIFKRGEEEEIESIFLGLFLGYLRLVGFLDYISVGGQGGSLAQKYWEYIKIPDLPRPKKEEISKYYYNPVAYNENKLNLEDFENEDIKITIESGIWQLDKQIKQIKQKVDAILHKIIMDEEVHIS